MDWLDRDPNATNILLSSSSCSSAVCCHFVVVIVEYNVRWPILNGQDDAAKSIGGCVKYRKNMHSVVIVTHCIVPVHVQSSQLTGWSSWCVIETFDCVCRLRVTCVLCLTPFFMNIHGLRRIPTTPAHTIRNGQCSFSRRIARWNFNFVRSLVELVQRFAIHWQSNLDSIGAAWLLITYCYADQTVWPIAMTRLTPKLSEKRKWLNGKSIRNERFSRSIDEWMNEY